jgi:hypothetical protein
MAIDTGENSLQDRALMASIEQPLGINLSPIIAPAFDRYGVLRVADPNSGNTPGTGQNPFIDIGAIQLADFNGPTASLITPAAGGATSVTVAAGAVPSTFQVELSDGNGVGVNNAAIIALLNAGTPPFSLTLNGNALASPNDYTFAFNSNTDTFTFSPASGVWAAGVYVITLNNSGATEIEDLAGNALKANNSSTGATSFTITIPSGSGSGGGGGGGTSGDGWQNPTNRYDINNDGNVNPLDALILIQALNNHLFPTGLLPQPAPSNPSDYYDVNGDGILNPQDLLAEIQYLNAQAALRAKGAVAEFAAASGASSDSVDSVGASASTDDASPALMVAAESVPSASSAAAPIVAASSVAASSAATSAVSSAVVPSAVVSAPTSSSSASSFTSNAWVAAVAQYHATSEQAYSVSTSGSISAAQGVAGRTTGLSAFLASSSDDGDDEDSFGSLAADVAAARAVKAN